MVHFIGAGPGDPELLTIKGKRLIDSADVPGGAPFCRSPGKLYI